MFVANHRSFLDIPLCHVAVPRPFRIVGKAELSRVPLFGWMYARQHILLERERTTSGFRALVAADHVLRAGDSLLIYPEGTTQHGGELLAPFKEGAFLLAHRRSVPIVPIVLRGTQAALPPDGRFLLQPGHLRAEFLPAVNVTQFDGPDSLAKHVYLLMLDRLQHGAAV
jgi:1-acyl-sn-glycerol-3-phosphate acyltransferase